MNQTKKLICTLLAMIMLVAMPLASFAEETSTLPFTDVPQDCFYRSNLEELYKNGIVKGKTATTFDPCALVSRAEFVTMIYRAFKTFVLFGSELDVEYKEQFPDVPNNQFYSIPVTWCVQNGIIKGYNNGTFGPNDPITREQMATILHRCDYYYSQHVSKYERTRYTGKEIYTFPDGNTVSGFARDGMNYCIACKYITGREYAPGKKVLAPVENASRAETVAMLDRWY